MTEEQEITHSVVLKQISILQSNNIILLVGSDKGGHCKIVDNGV